MNYTNNNRDASSESQRITYLERQQELLLHFSPEFVEKHKQSYVFKGVMEELAKGTNPYSIIQQLIEHLTGNHQRD
jgi:hypothetical protein